MSRGKKVYFGLLLLFVFLVSTAHFSYAFFASKNEEHGKLNIVVGTLDYKLESIDLQNNTIVVKAKEIKEIQIKLSSLNDISSKYELYYTLDQENSNIRIGYSKETEDSILGTVDANSTKNITVVIRNESDTDSTVTFNVIGGLINNNLVLTNGTSLNQVVGKYKTYSIGDEITLTDGSKWHVLENSDEMEENVVLLSDYNLNSDGSYNTCCFGTDRSDSKSYWCSPRAFDSDFKNIYDENDSNNIGYFIKNIYSPLVSKEMPGVTNISLPTLKQISNLLGIDEPISFTFISKQQLELYPWLFQTNYWLKDTTNTNPWHVVGDTKPNLDYGLGAGDSAYLGARPTITIPKKYILNTYHSNHELPIGTSVEAVDGSKWHVLEASSSDSEYVTLLSDYNLNSDGSYNTGCGRDINSTYICSPMAFDSSINQNCDENNPTNICYFMKNTYKPLITKSLVRTTNVTLPTAEQLATADEKEFSQSVISGFGANRKWLTTTNYWTKTLNSSISYSVWFVGGDSWQIGSDGSDMSSIFGARPVITTLKSNSLAQ